LKECEIVILYNTRWW